MKCWNSAFNAEHSRVVIVTVQVGAVKIYVAAVDALKKKERQDETWFTEKKLMPFWVSSPAFEILRYFFQVCFESHPVYDQTQDSGAVFSLILRNFWCVGPHATCVFFLVI